MFCVEHIGFGVEQQGWRETNSGKSGSLDQLPNKAVVSRKDVATDWTVVETKIKINKDKLVLIMMRPLLMVILIRGGQADNGFDDGNDYELSLQWAIYVFNAMHET